MKEGKDVDVNTKNLFLFFWMDDIDKLGIDLTRTQRWALEKCLVPLCKCHFAWAPCMGKNIVMSCAAALELLHGAAAVVYCANPMDCLEFVESVKLLLGHLLKKDPEMTVKTHGKSVTQSATIWAIGVPHHVEDPVFIIDETTNLSASVRAEIKTQIHGQPHCKVISSETWPQFASGITLTVAWEDEFPTWNSTMTSVIGYPGKIEQTSDGHSIRVPELQHYEFIPPPRNIPKI